MADKRSKVTDNRPDFKGGFVYFARAHGTKLIKIGHSIKPDARESDLQVGSGEKIEIILTVPGTRKHERRFHVQFRACRVRGEWFREEGRLHAFLRERNLHLPEKDPSAITVAEYPDLKLLEGVVRGYCISKETKQKLLDYGLTEKQIYHLGDGAEDLGACLHSFREQAGWIVVAQDLRIFSDSNKQSITDQVGDLEKRRIRLLDITNPGDKTYSALVHRAHAKIAGTRFEKSRGAAKRTGRKGGEAKAVEAEIRRDKIAVDWLIRKYHRLPASHLGAEGGALRRENLRTIATPPLLPETMREEWLWL